MKNNIHKTSLFLLVTLLLPVVVCAQLSVNSGSEVRVKASSYVTVTGDVDVSSGAVVTLEGNMTVDGDFDNAGTASAFTVTSDETSTGSLILNSTASGDITVERFLTHDRWHYFSEPINTSGTFSALTMGLTGGNSGDQFYSWDEPSNMWIDILNGSGWSTESFTPGKGYAITYITTDKTLSLTGTPYLANQTINIISTSSTYFSGSNLVGNPFCSSLAINSNAQTTCNFLDQNSGVLDASFQAIYLWNEGDNWEDGDDNDYVTINNSSDATFVTPGQAFMVKSASASETVTFNTTARAHGVSSFMKKSDKQTNCKLELLVTNLTTSNRTTIAFIPGMTVGLDPSYDAGKMKGNENLALYTRLVADNGIDFAIQALPNSNIEEFVVTVGVDVRETDLFEFSITQQLLDDYNIVLEDRRNNTFTNLRWENYSTTITESGTGRFFLHFKDATAVEQLAQQPAITATYIKGEIRIINPERKTGPIQLFSITGQLQGSFTLNGNSVQQVSVNQPQGIYLLSIYADNQRHNYKLFIY